MQRARPNSPTLKRVIDGELCSGCGLCAGVSGGNIEMRSMPPGYNRPVQTSPVSAAVEQTIASSCPGAVVAGWPTTERRDPCWGPYRDVLTGNATDEKVRFEGSSGGVLSALLIHALETGLIDRVLHIGASASEPTRNATRVSRSRAEILAGAGSRYTASSPLESINAELEAGGTFAFVGKPCDVSALRRLGLVDDRVTRTVPLMLSFFCGGIPSHDGVHRILDKLKVDPRAVTKFRFRGQGWPGDCAAETPAGEARMSYADSWGGHLSKEVQFRCKICPDAVGGTADVACADAWLGDEDGYPTFVEADGRSLILTRNATGESLVRAAVATGSLAIQQAELSDIATMQPSQARRKRLILARTLALLPTLQPRPLMRGLLVEKAARQAPFAEAVRNTLGTLRRTLLGRRSRL